MALLQWAGYIIYMRLNNQYPGPPKGERGVSNQYPLAFACLLFELNLDYIRFVTGHSNYSTCVICRRDCSVDFGNVGLCG